MTGSILKSLTQSVSYHFFCMSLEKTGNSGEIDPQKSLMKLVTGAVFASKDEG